MKISDTTPIHVIIALCFVAITVMSMMGAWFYGFYLTTLVIALYMMLGAIKHGTLDMTFFLFPIATFFVSWIIGFTLAQKYAVLFYDRAPEFTLLGFHPSFFWVVVLYWLAALVILGLGFSKLRDRWMSQEEWDGFKRQMAEMPPRNMEDSQ